MNVRSGRSMHLVLDGGGPLCVWSEKPTGGMRRRLLITTTSCDSPECECRDVWVSGILLDDRFKQVENQDHGLSYTFVPRFGESSEPPPLRQLAATVNVESGEVCLDARAAAELHDEEMLAWLREGLDDCHMEILRKRWRLAKGLDRDRWRRSDWSWWEPGQMVSWAEVFPDEFNIVLSQKDDIYWMDDMYCINPGCGCKEAGFHFSRITTGQIEDLGAIRVGLPSGRFSDFMSEHGTGRLLKRLWNELSKRPGIHALLNDRMKRMKAIGPEIVRLSTGGKEVEQEASRKKTGRNAPCPCGSGKKFKNCCGR